MNVSVGDQAVEAEVQLQAAKEAAQQQLRRPGLHCLNPDNRATTTRIIDSIVKTKKAKQCW